MTGLYKWVVLAATRDNDVRNTITETLRDLQSRIFFVSDVKEFFAILIHEHVDIIIFDPQIGCLDAPDAFAVARELYPGTTGVLLSDGERFEVASPLLEKGFIYRACKPLDSHYLRQVFAGACRRENNRAENL